MILLESIGYKAFADIYNAFFEVDFVESQDLMEKCGKAAISHARKVLSAEDLERMNLDEFSILERADNMAWALKNLR